MLELARDLLPLLRAGETVATVTVTGVARSAPRGIGSAMAVTRDARVIGSISGGCVEADAVALALAALATADPDPSAPAALDPAVDVSSDRETLGPTADAASATHPPHATAAGRNGSAARFGFSDDQAFAAGLACGGTIDAVISVVRPSDAVAVAALERAAANRRSAVGIVARGPRAGTIVASPVRPGGSRIESTPQGDELLIVASAPRPRLLLLGAGEHAAALSRVGTAAGFAVSVCDVWELLVTRERFPDAHELVTAVPHEYLASLGSDDIDERTAVCVLTHDVRLDIPAIEAALALPIGFVGALGARSTVARRAELLRAAGATDADLARLHSPLGLDLGGATPDETAVAVVAEIMAARHGGTGRPLRDVSGPLHRRGPGHGAEASEASDPAPSCSVVAG
jgi:xanthine dehydrogenase accessory factor